MKKKSQPKPIEAIVEHGCLKPLKRLALSEHQRVWITILAASPATPHLGALASKSSSFRFLAHPAEDRYSLSDGQPL